MLIVLAHSYDFYAPYCPAPDAKHIQDVVDLAEGGKVDLEVTLRVDEGIDAFRDITDYGFIIINTHGSNNGFSTGEAVFSNNLIAFSDDVEVADGVNEIASALREKDITITSYWNYGTDEEVEIDEASYDLTFEYIQKQNWQFDNAIWVANYCYSGNYNGRMGSILAAKGVKSFYGYSYTNGRADRVTNDLCWRAEDTIIRSMLYDVDTTGIAHLANRTTLLQDDRYWKDLPLRSIQRKAERFIFGPQTMNHYLDRGYHYEDCSESFVDSRDGKEYLTVCIGDQTWMAENLDWDGAGICYDNSSGNCSSYGRLYSIKELTGLQTSTDSTVVKGLCPDGWHVPSEAEYQELIDYCGGETEAADKLRSSSGWPTSHSDVFGFNLKAAGHYTEGGGNSLFRWIGEDTKLWTSSQNSSGLYIALSAFHPGLSFGSFTATGQEWYFSCRCIKD